MFILAVLERVCKCQVDEAFFQPSEGSFHLASASSANVKLVLGWLSCMVITRLSLFRAIKEELSLRRRATESSAFANGIFGDLVHNRLSVFLSLLFIFIPKCERKITLGNEQHQNAASMPRVSFSNLGRRLIGCPLSSKFGLFKHLCQIDMQHVRVGPRYWIFHGMA